MRIEPTAPETRPVLDFLRRALRLLIEVPAAVLILVEIVLLTSGVVARYFFHSPLVWGDEVASLLFLWLSMLGTAIALDRGEHMRLTTFVSRLGPRNVARADMLGTMIVLLFASCILLPAFDYAVEERYVTTASLEISNSWRAAAVGVGLVLIILISLLRLARYRNVRQLAAIAGSVVVVAGLVWMNRLAIQDFGNYNLVIFFGVLVGFCVLAGVPIAFAFGIATIGYLTTGSSMPLMVLVNRMDEAMAHLILLSVPLFIFLGLLIEMTGMARAMVEFLASMLGRVRGGMSYVLLGAMYLVSGISGAKAADMAAIAPILIPEMRRRGNSPDEMVALLAASSAMSETIPPSLVLITIGSVTGVSIAALFTGGLMPALFLAVALGLLAYFRAKNEDLSLVPKVSGKMILRGLLIAAPALILPFIIRAAVVEGVATATEVSTVGIAYTVICGLLVYRRFDWSRLYSMLIETAVLTGAIMFIIGTATGMAWCLTQSGFSQQLAGWMALVPGGKFGFLLVSIVAFIILGSVLEGIPAIVLFGPLLFPIAKAAGVHEVHYAIVVILSMGVGLFAPPFGVGFYTACAISKVDPDKVMPHIWAYLGVLLLAVLLVAAIPWISIGFL